MYGYPDISQTQQICWCRFVRCVRDCRTLAFCPHTLNIWHFFHSFILSFLVKLVLFMIESILSFLIKLVDPENQSWVQNSHRRRPGTLLKKRLSQMFSCELTEMFKNTLITEHLWATASVSAIITDYDCFYFMWTLGSAAG